MGKLNSIENQINSEYKDELKTLSEENGTLDEVMTADFQLNEDNNIKRNDRGYLIINNHEQNKIKAGLIANKYDFDATGIELLIVFGNNE